MATEKEIGTITHYFGKINVGIIELADTLKVGDTIHVGGKKTDLTQAISSMQIEHKEVNEARAGESVGVKFESRVYEKDKVFKVLP